MKIAYLSTFYPFRGGIAQFNAALTRALQKEHEVKAFTFTRQYPNFLFPGTSQFVTDDDKVDNIQADRVLDSINPFSYYRTAKKIASWKPDILLTKFWMPFFGPSLGKVAQKLKKNGVINISVLDNVIPHEKRKGDILLAKYFLKHQHKFIVMSNQVKNDLLSLHTNAEYVHCEHPLYNHFGKKTDKLAARENFGIPSDRKVLLFFGFIRKYKGLDLLLYALNNLPDDYHLIIAGEVYGSFEPYQKIIDNLHLSSRITKIVKYINDKEVPDIFSAADVCVLPYKSATQSGIVGISYHFDLPVVATDVGGLKEMIANYNTGIIADTPDAKAIENSIQKYFHKELYPELSKNILRYKEIASWETLAQKIIDFAKYSYTQ